MAEIKNKFNELKAKERDKDNSKDIDSNIQTLEKQVKWFRDEATRLDDVLKQKNEEIKRLKNLNEQLENDRKF